MIYLNVLGKCAGILVLNHCGCIFKNTLSLCQVAYAMSDAWVAMVGICFGGMLW